MSTAGTTRTNLEQAYYEAGRALMRDAGGTELQLCVAGEVAVVVHRVALDLESTQPSLARASRANVVQQVACRTIRNTIFAGGQAKGVWWKALRLARQQQSAGSFARDFVAQAVNEVLEEMISRWDNLRAAIERVVGSPQPSYFDPPVKLKPGEDPYYEPATLPELLALELEEDIYEMADAETTYGNISDLHASRFGKDEEPLPMTSPEETIAEECLLDSGRYNGHKIEDVLDIKLPRDTAHAMQVLVGRALPQDLEMAFAVWGAKMVLEGHHPKTVLGMMSAYARLRRRVSRPPKYPRRPPGVTNRLHNLRDRVEAGKATQEARLGDQE